MGKKRCESKKKKEAQEGKFICRSCGLQSDKKDKLCKPARQ